MKKLFLPLLILMSLLALVSCGDKSSNPKVDEVVISGSGSET